MRHILLFIFIFSSLVCLLEARRGSSSLRSNSQGSSSRGSISRGSSSRGSNSRGSSSRGSNSRGSSSRGSSSLSTGIRHLLTRKSRGSTLTKAFVLGAGAYGSYKLGKLSTKFRSSTYGSNLRWSFNDWNDWRENDGFLCRTNEDCNWIDSSMDCEDYDLTFTPNVS